MNENRKSISELCKESLKEKWYNGSIVRLYKKCPFCYECDIECDKCLCPSDICEKYATKGYIHELTEKYGGDGKVYNLNKEDLNKMIALFEKHIE